MKKLIFVLLMVFLVTPIMLAQVYQKITGYNSYVNALAFSPGGKYIASGEKDGTIKIMDADNGELIKVIKTKNSIFKLAFSNEAKEICAGIAPLLSISAEIDPFIVVYDMYNGLLKQNIDVKSRSPNFFYSNPDKKLMTIVPELTMDNCTYTYDYSLSTYLNSNCYKLEFNNYSLSDNNYSVNYIDRIHFWSFNSPWTVSASGKYIAICPENEKSDKISTNPVKNFDKQYNESTIGNLIYFYDIDSKKLINKIKIINSYLKQKNILISDDAKYFYYVAVEYFDDVIKILDINKDEDIKSLKGHSREILCLALHPSGNYIASGSKDNTIRIWDLNSGKTIKVLEGHNDNVNYISFSPDGRFLVSASDDKSVIIWDLSTFSSEIDLYSLKYSLDKGIKKYLIEEKSMELNKPGNLNDIKSIDEKYAEKYNNLYKLKLEEYNNKKK